MKWKLPIVFHRKLGSFANHREVTLGHAVSLPTPVPHGFSHARAYVGRREEENLEEMEKEGERKRDGDKKNLYLNGLQMM